MGGGADFKPLMNDRVVIRDPLDGERECYVLHAVAVAPHSQAGGVAKTQKRARSGAVHPPHAKRPNTASTPAAPPARTVSPRPSRTEQVELPARHNTGVKTAITPMSITASDEIEVWNSADMENRVYQSSTQFNIGKGDKYSFFTRERPVRLNIVHF
eukprot:NODE_1452_length_598_cov_705.768670_g1158_i0.p1 GENE.NODE_1452_length_598_cov_705.768670_g1158_i0~~NODE_1452_length_598_cov_705.768670_g1158_i0.p1  ORF type:complete len:157 (-),score=11.27 NODE_1452_length_598_cov_705.768670_g1158_i0:100-570(-)